jgi:hypothetical protein
MRRRGFEAFQRHQASTLLASRLLTTALQRQRLDAEHEHTRGRRAEASARAHTPQLWAGGSARREAKDSGSCGTACTRQVPLVSA